MGELGTMAANGSETFSQLLAGRTLAASQALRYALLAAEALRELHDAGRTHGAISADAIAVGGPHVQLLAASPSGKPSDVETDILAFGGVLAGLLTGVAEANRLVGNCLAPDPAVRWRIRQVIIELKLLIVKERLQRMRRTADPMESMAACLSAIISRLDERRLDERPGPYWFPGRSARGWRVAPAPQSAADQGSAGRH